MGSYEPYRFGYSDRNTPSSAPYGAPVTGNPPFPSNSTPFQQQQRQRQSTGMESPTQNGNGAFQFSNDPTFDILDWHPAYQSCQRYFLDHSQHEPGTQALCALINIRLPFQWLQTPITSSTPSSHGPSPSSSNAGLNPFGSGGGAPTSRSATSNFSSPNRSRAVSEQVPQTFISLIPYIRRLVVTGFDKAPILHGLFGDDYQRGALPHLECERRNYLFAAKHGGWRSCKKQYDEGSGGGGDESVPFMKPLDGSTRVEELVAAEKEWSHWLAMEDWMVGPRAPGDTTTEEGTTNSGSLRSSQQGAADRSRDTVGATGPGGALPDASQIDGII